MLRSKNEFGGDNAVGYCIFFGTSVTVCRVSYHFVSFIYNGSNLIKHIICLRLTVTRYRIFCYCTQWILKTKVCIRSSCLTYIGFEAGRLLSRYILRRILSDMYLHRQRSTLFILRHYLCYRKIDLERNVIMGNFMMHFQIFSQRVFLISFYRSAIEVCTRASIVYDFYQITGLIIISIFGSVYFYSNGQVGIIYHFPVCYVRH